MFTAYFDKSGGGQDDRTVVSGWMSSVAKWLEFEARWMEVLAAEGLPYFHMKEFAHSIGPFAKFKGDEIGRIRLIQALCTVIDETVMFGVGIGISGRIFRAVGNAYAITSVFKNEFILAARLAVEEINQSLRGRGYPNPRRWVEYVFDRGDMGKGALVDLLDADGLNTPVFKASRDDPAKGVSGVVQLQAADFIAYEHFRMFQTVFDEPFSVDDETRKSAERLLKNVPTIYHDLSEFNMAEICRSRGLSRRDSVATR